MLTNHAERLRPSRGDYLVTPFLIPPYFREIIDSMGPSLLFLMLLSPQAQSAKERNCCSVACPLGDSSKCAISGDHCDTHNSCVIRTEAGSLMIDAECYMEKDSYGDNTEEECLQLNPSKTQSNTFDVNHLPFKLIAFSGLEDKIQFVGLDLQYPYSQFTQLEYSIKGERDTKVKCVKVVKATPQFQTENYLSVDCHEGLNLTKEVYVLRMCATGVNERCCGKFVFTPPTQKEVVKADIEVELINIKEGINCDLYIVLVFAFSLFYL